MKNKKVYPKSMLSNRILFVLAIVSVLIFGTASYLQFQVSQVEKSSVVFDKKSETVYPRQYSDKTITQNAIISDPKFRNSIIFDRNVLLASVGRSIKTVNTGNVSTLPERGVWLWTPILQITPEYADSVIAGANQNGIRNIYLSIDSYLDIFVMPPGEEKNKIRKEFDSIVSDFIKKAKEKNISVDAEGGWRNWAEDGHTYKAFATLEYTMGFNKSHDEKFRGFQYDVEPYLLESYENNKKSVLYNFVHLIDQAVSAMNRSDLELSVVIPEFYDVSDSSSYFSYNGKSGSTIDHLLRVLERRSDSKIIVMSYRNFAKGDDGSIDVSIDEIKKANDYGTKIIIAQETGDVEPPYITFFKTSRSYYDKQIQVLQKTFSGDKSYGGLATHYANSLFELK